MKENGWKLYPNPASDKIHLIHQVVTKGQFKVVNVTGAEILSGNINSSGITAITTEQLANGFYLVIIDSDNERSVLHFNKH